MKKLKIVLVSFLLLILASVVAGGSAKAAGHYVGVDNGRAVISKDQVVDSSAYLAGNTVIVEGTVKGDLYCAGESVSIKGIIEGDVICAGATISIDGDVLGDIRVAGSDVVLGGAVAGSASVAGSEVTLAENFKLGKDLTGGASTLNILGSVGRDVTAGAQDMTIGGSVGRDVVGHTGNLNFTPNAKIAGNLVYSGESEATIPKGVVAGKVDFTKRDNQSSSGSSDISMALFMVSGIVVLAVAATLLFPRFVHTASSLAPRDVLLAFLIGVAFVILLPIFAILSMFTGVGLLLGMVLMFAWIIALLLSSVFVAYYFGTLALQKRATNAILVALVGSLIVGVALMLPLINVLVALFMVFAGTGMQIMHIKYQFSKNPYTIKP